MKKSLILLFVCILSSLASYSQTTQNGVTKEYNEKNKKTPLSNVEIVVKNAGSNVSAKDGTFQLSFRTLKAGAKVEVSKIEKDGYEVFNKDALDAWRIANDGSTFTIVLCKSSKFKALKDKYNAVASKSYKEQKAKEEARLAELLKQGKLKQAEYDKQLKAIQDKYNEELENLDNYIDRFARIDLSELLGPERKIMELVQAGKIDDAIKAYEDMQLEKRFSDAVDNINKTAAAIDTLRHVKKRSEEARDIVFAQIHNEIGVLKLRGGSESFKIIADKLRFCTNKDSDNVNILREFADFLLDQTHYQEAEKYWLRLSNIYSQDEKNGSDYVHALSSLGIICKKTQRFDEAKLHFNHALAVAEKLVKSDSMTYISDLVVALNLVGQYWDIMNDDVKALEYFNRANSIAEQLYAENSDKYSETLTSVLANIAVAKQNLDDVLGAAKALIKSEKVIEGMFRKKSSAYREKYATILYNIAAMYISGHDNKMALKYNLLSMQQIDTLYHMNPDVYADNLRRAYYTSGIIYDGLGNADSAKYCLDKARELAEKLYAENPLVYSRNYSNVMNSLGNVLANMKRYTEAEEVFRKVIDIRKSNYEKNPHAHCLSYMSILFNIAALYCDETKYQDAISYYKTAIDILSKERKGNQGFSRKYEAQCLEALASCYVNAQMWQEADSCFSSALSLFNTLYLEAPSNYGYYIAMLVFNYSSGLIARGEYAKAEPVLSDAYQKFMSSTYHDGDMNLLLLKSCIEQNIGYCLISQNKDIARAEKLLSDNLMEKKIMYQAQPDLYVEYYAEAMEMMRIFYMRANDLSKAETLARENVHVCSEMVEKYGDVFITKQYITYKELAIVLSKEDKHQEALENFRKALDIIDNNLKAFQNLPINRTSTLAAIGVECYHVGKNTEGREYIDKAYDEIKYETPSTKSDESDIQYVMDAKGFSLVMNNDNASALDMWNKILKDNPDYLHDNLNHTSLYDALRAKGLVK